MRIKKGEITHLLGDTNDGTTVTEQQVKRLKELALKLPPPKQTGPHITLNETQNLKLAKYECEGDSLIRMIYGNTNTVSVFQDTRITENQTFRQFFVITHIIFSKKSTVLPEILQQKRTAPIEKPVSVANLSVLYQNHDGAWRECQEISIALTPTDNEEPKWLKNLVINIEPDKLYSYSIRGTIPVKGVPDQNNETRRRLHKSLPQPFKLKIVVNDNFGKQCSVIVEQLNQKLQLINRERLTKYYQSTFKEWIAFIYADDCETDERIYMTMYIDKENRLIIRNCSVNYYTLARKDLRTMEYNAKQNQTPEVHLDKIDYGNSSQSSKAFALFDLETSMFYAVRFEVSTSTSKTEETVLIPIEKIQ